MTPFRLPEYDGYDDPLVPLTRDDFSGGENTRVHASKILPNQAETIENWDIGVPGQLQKIPGTEIVEDLGDDAGVGLFGFDPDGGTPVLVAVHGQSLATWPGSTTFTTRTTTLTNNLLASIIKVGESGEGDVFLLSNGTDNVYRYEPDDYSSPQDLGDTNTSPPKTRAMCYYRNRVWGLKTNLLYFSDAYPADYSTAFDRTTNAFRVPVGAARALVPLREIGILCLGADQVWGLNPSFTPGSNDEPQKILDIGCSAGNTCVQVGDDVWFLAPDGLRGVFRTQQDKLNYGQSFPLSYLLKTRYEALNWTYIDKACAVYFDNKYFLSVPTGSATYNNQIWVFYPTQMVNIGNNIVVPASMVITDVNIAAFAKMKVNNEERLYGISSTDGSVCRLWTGYDNNGTAITATLRGREENFDDRTRYKVGGEIEVEAEAVGDATLEVSVAIDGRSFSKLFDVELTNSDAPQLPVQLPFSLADSFVVREKTNLESLGRYRTIQFEIVNDDLNESIVAIYGINMTALMEEYENE